MLDYNTIFFAECQDGNGFLFHFINFAQTQVIFYSRLTSRDIPFLLYMCSCIQSRSLQRKLCSISNSSPSQKTVKNCCPIYKKAAEDTSTMGRILGDICLSGLGFLGGVLFRSLAYGIFFSRFAANFSVILQTLFSWYVP